MATDNLNSLELMDLTQAAASDSVTTGLGVIASLGDISFSIPEQAALELSYGEQSGSSANAELIESGNVDIPMASQPVAPDYVAPGYFDIGELPDYSVAVPTLLDVDFPNPFDALAPTKPTLDEVATPVEQGFVLPDVPQFAALNIPAAPSFDVPPYDAVAPDAPVAPDVRLEWNEIAYQSDLLAEINARLIDIVNGASTALEPGVEDALYQRGVDKECMLTHEATKAALASVAARGFAIPGGQLVMVVQQAIDDGLRSDAALSRAIMEDQTKLEQENFQFAFRSAMQLESQMIGYFNQAQSRALEAARLRVDTVVNLFNARVSMYGAEVQVFGAKAEAFKARMQAALAQLESYKATLQGLQIKGQLNVQLAQQYSAQIDGVKAMAEVYRARVQAASLTVDANKNRTDLYRAEIDGYSSLVKSESAKVQGYVSRVQGEVVKAELFSEQVKGYTSRVKAYKVLVDEKLSEASLSFKQMQQFPLELYRAKIASHQVQVRGEAARLDALASTFEARVNAYAATGQSSTKVSYASIDLAMARVRESAAIAKSTLRLAINSAIGEVVNQSITHTSAQASAQAAAQLASAAMAAMNVTASVSDTTSNSISRSSLNSRSVSANNSTSKSASTSINESQSVNIATGDSVSITESQSQSETQAISQTTNNSISTSTTNSVSNETQKSVRNVNSRGVSNRFAVSNQTIYNHKG